MTKYANLTKGQSRGWIWNQIDSRLPKPKYERQHCRIYTLIGDTTEEFVCGLKRNFSPFNIIGIDVRKKPVKDWRKAGGIAVQAPLDLVLLTSKVRPHAVICDYCGGLTKSNFHTFWLSYMKMQAPGAIAINMLRGRDDIVKVRSEFNLQGICHGLGLNPLNRAHILYSKLLIDSFFFDNTIQQAFGANVNGFMRFAIAIAKQLQPKFHSYRSIDGGNYFDSMVISLPKTSGFTDVHTLDDVSSKYAKERSSSKDIAKVKRRMSALEAVRTMAIQKNRGRMYCEHLCT